MDHFLRFPSGVFHRHLLLVLVSVEAGYRWARYQQTRSQQEKEAPVGAMVGATLGLLAFLLAITFAMAAESFHARRVALLDEVNAIRTAYLRTDLIVEPQRTEVRKLLAEYVDERLHGSEYGAKPSPITRQKSCTTGFGRPLLWISTAVRKSCHFSRFDEQGDRSSRRTHLGTRT